MANKAIRGITVEIGGDTTKLGKAIENSEKKSRSLQVELKQIEKLLKFDPTNVELLAQKQKVLTESVEETSKKLEILKEAEKQVIAQFERGEIGEDQLRAFQREIAQTEKELSDMKSELQTATRNLEEFGDNNGVAKEKTEKLEKAIREEKEALEAEKKALKEAEEAQKKHEKAVEDAKEELGEFNAKASETFDTLKTGATVLAGAVTAVGGYTLKVSNDFDKAFNTLITKTGASVEEMDSLNEAMENVYGNNFGESIEDVANAMSIVKNATKLTGKGLESVTENALLMRDVFDFEVNESIRAVNSLMDQFGIGATQAYNLIAQGAQKGLNQNDDLLDTINEYSVHFKNAGYSADEMFNMLANGVEAGTWSVDKLGDAVKEFNIRMSDGSAKDAVEALGFSWEAVSESWSKGGDEAKEVFNMLFNELDGLENTTEGYSIGVGLLGTMYEDLGQTTVLALSQTDGAISKTSNALWELNNTKYDDIGSAIQGLKRTLETDLIDPLGDELKPIVEDLIGYIQKHSPEIKEVLSTVVSKVGEFITYVVDNREDIVSTIASIGAGLLTWNAVTMITNMVNAIKAFKTANEGATIAQALLNAVMNANPLMLIVKLLATVVVAIVAFVATNEEAREKVKQIWENIKKFVGEAVDKIVTFFTKTIPDAIDNFKNKAKQIFNTIIDFIKNNWQSLLLLIVNPFAGAFSLLYDNCESFRKFIDNILTNIKNLFVNCKNGIVNTFSNIGSWFSTTFSNAWTAIKNVFAGWGDFFGGLWDTIKNKFSTIGTNIANAISSAVKSGINGVISSIESTINSGIGLINGAIRLANKLPGVNVGTIGTVSFPRLARGGIVDRPTFAQIGEDGAEAVIPLERNTEWIRGVAKELNATRVAQDAVANTALLNKLDGIYERLNRLQIVLDTGTLVGETIDKIDAGLANKQLLSARGV